jgi:hypothetical protein
MAKVNPRGSYSKVRANVPVSRLPQTPDATYVPDSAVPDHVPVQVLVHVPNGPMNASAAVNAEPLSVPVRGPVDEVVAAGPVLANVPVIDDPDWLSVSWVDRLPAVELTTVPTHVPVMDDGLLGLGPQPLATARNASSATNGRIAKRRHGVDMEAPSLVTGSVG